MSVLIEGMDMPTSCSDCPIGDALGCPFIPGVPAWWKEYDIAVKTNRLHSQCPLGPAEELSKPSWISVTERLPEKSGNYLTAFEDGTAMAVNEFMHPRDWLTEEGRKANPNGKWYWGGVTHWMPLPEPPKEEKDAGD